MDSDPDLERAVETIAAEPPRRLRLGELLRALGARTPGDPEVPRRAEINLGELVDLAAEAGFGFLIGVLSLIAIPFVGLSTPFGLAIALLGAQLIRGRSTPWLPRRARARALKMTMLDRIATPLARRSRWIVKLTRPRWEAALRPRLVGLGVVVLALALALPIPIPGSNLVFLIPLFIYAIGLLERDGVWIVVGHLAMLLDVALLIAFGGVVIAVLDRLWRWLF